MLASVAFAFVLHTACVTAASLPATASYDEYAAKFTNGWNKADEVPSLVRRQLFESRASLVREHNARERRTWTAGLNKFSDRTTAELEAHRGWRRGGDGASGTGISLLSAATWRTPAPIDQVDWRNLTVAKTVPNQGECGSCWAVATVSMLQAQREIHMGKAQKLSAQTLVNCVPNPRECGGQGGCRGATVELALQWVQTNGLLSEEDAPYHGIDGSCSVGTSEGLSFVAAAKSLTTLLRGAARMADVVKHNVGGGAQLGLTGWLTLPSNKAGPLMSALMTGPVAISVAASDWFAYDHGIFNGCDKDTVIDHAVTMMGYGASKEESAKYWIVQNSWGADWGENGYIRVLRHDTPEEDDAWCGTDSKPADGISCKPYPDSVEVCGMCGLLYDSVAVHFGANTR